MAYSSGYDPMAPPPPPAPAGMMRQAGMTSRDDLGGLETEMISRARLAQLKRARRLPWLFSLLLLAVIASMVAWGLEQQLLLQNELRDLKLAQAETGRLHAEALAAAEQKAAALAALEKKATEQETTSAENLKLIAALRGQVDSKDAEIESSANTVTLSVVDRILFPSGQSGLSPGGLKVLASVGEVLKGLRDKQIMIGGHTDDQKIHTPEFPSNWELSSARAVNVVRYLVEEVGVSPKHVSAAAYSQYRPRTKERARNRRIEILLTPIPKVTSAAFVLPKAEPPARVPTH